MKVCLISQGKQLHWVTTHPAQCPLEKKDLQFGFEDTGVLTTHSTGLLKWWESGKQEGLKVQLLPRHQQDTVLHRGSAPVNHSWFKGFSMLESLKYRQAPAPEHLTWTQLSWYLHGSRVLHQRGPEAAAEWGGRWQPLQMETVEEHSVLAAAYSKSPPTVQALLHYYFIFLAVFWSN